MKTLVGHCRKDDVDVYVGRGNNGQHLLSAEIGENGWLGNPYSVDDHGREKCIAKYREKFEQRLDKDPKFKQAVRSLAGKTLGCFCQRVEEDEPACHAEVIAEHAERLAQS